METRTLKITGLDCAEEVGALKTMVGKLNGVDHIGFHLLEAGQNGPNENTEPP